MDKATEMGAQNYKLHQMWVQFFLKLDNRSNYGRLLFAMAAGVILSLAFAPTNIFVVVFLVFPACLQLIAHSENGKAAFAYGWWFGLGFFAVGLNWIGHSFTQQDQVPAILAPFAVFLLSAVLAIYSGLAFWLTWRLGANGWYRILLFSAAWVLAEILRGVLFTGFPWHIAGSLWANWLPVAQSSYWLGVYGLSFVTLLVATSPAILFENRRTSLKDATGIVGAFAMLGTMAVAGYMRLENNPTRFHLNVTLRLVQANVLQKEKWLSYLIDDHFEKHMQLSRVAGTGGKAEGVKLLIWPETAVQQESFDREGSLARWRMSRLLEFGSYAITGTPRYEIEDDTVHFYNSLVAMNSKGDLYARYDKSHLVPFGEYLPLKGLLEFIGLQKLADGGVFLPGEGRQTINLPGIPAFSPLICYEAIFPGDVIDTQNRPEWLLNISNDAWFGMTNGPYQHLALSRFRAIEEGLPLVRSTSTGVSAVVDAYGRTISSMGVNKQGAVDSPLPKAIEAAPLLSTTRTAIITLLCSLILLGRLVFLRWSEWQDKRKAKAAS